MQIQRREQRLREDREWLERLERDGVAALKGTSSLYSPIPYDQTMVPPNKLQNVTAPSKLIDHQYIQSGRQVHRTVMQLTATHQRRPNSASSGLVRMDRPYSACARVKHPHSSQAHPSPSPRLGWSRPQSVHGFQQSPSRVGARRKGKVHAGCRAGGYAYARSPCGFGNPNGLGRSGAANRYV